MSDLASSNREIPTVEDGSFIYEYIILAAFLAQCIFKYPLAFPDLNQQLSSRKKMDQLECIMLELLHLSVQLQSDSRQISVFHVNPCKKP